MGICSLAQTTSVAASIGYNLSVLNVLIAVISALSIVYIFFSIFRSVREEHFSLYLGFSLLSAFTFLLAVVQRMLPEPAAASEHGAVVAYGTFQRIFLAVLISMQWFIQTGAVFFLLIRNPGQSNLRWRVLLPALCMMMALLIPWVITTVLGQDTVGEVLGEGILILFFCGALLLISKSFRKCVGLRDFHLHPRPMMGVWGGFMLYVHVTFLIMYALKGLVPESEAAACTYVFFDSIYYIVYAPILMLVIRKDSRYWSEHGSLLLDMQLAMEDHANVSSSNMPGSEIGGIPLIRFADLVFKEKVGSGGYSEVYRATLSGANVAVKVFRVAQGQLETMNELLREARILYGLNHPNVLLLLGLAMRGRRVKKKGRKQLAVKNEDSRAELSAEAVVNPGDVALTLGSEGSAKYATTDDSFNSGSDDDEGDDGALVAAHESFPLLGGADANHKTGQAKVNGHDRDDGDDNSGAMIDLSSHDVILCAVTTFYSGGSLWDRIHARKTAFPMEERVSLLRDVARGMSYLHSQGLIHRDLKSPNVLIGQDNVGVIADFGLAKNHVGLSATTMTAIGTPHWMAPEILRGEKYARSADVWSFAVIVWEVLTRRVPYEGIPPIVLMQRVAHEDLRLRLPAEMEPSVEPLRQVMTMCFEDAEKRPSFEEIEMLLDRL